jgi:preprotein translocase subunit SecG
MILSYISMTLLMITGIFMIIIILLQRGRGGGLAGAFGGLGGQSAFGTKAGDVFTRITIGLAIFWLVLSGLSSLALERDSNRRYTPDAGDEAVEAPESGMGTSVPAEDPFSESTPSGKEAEKPLGSDAAPGKSPPPAPTSPKTTTPADKTGADAKSSGTNQDAAGSKADGENAKGDAGSGTPGEAPATK